jgi:hypothetical protein
MQKSVKQAPKNNKFWRIYSNSAAQLTQNYMWSIFGLKFKFISWRSQIKS